MAVRVPSGPDFPLSLVNSHPFGPARSDPGRGARRSRSLDGEDRAGIIQGEGKGDIRTKARRRSRSVRFPSLPAGINTDDSDPLGPG